MAITRVCSYTATIQTPLPPEEYSAILVTFAQNQQNMIIKQLGDPGITVESDSVIVQLTQEETMQLAAGVPALMQIRCFKAPYQAPGSMIWAIEVYDALNEEVLS